jgi:hypothetical protein
MWVASTTSLRQAREFVRSLNSTSDGTYSIVDMRSRRVVEPSEGSAAETMSLSQRLMAPIRRLQNMARSLDEPRSAQP